MKVAVPSTGEGGMESEVFLHFGRCDCYTILDTQTEEVKILENVSVHSGGQKFPPELLAENDVNILICSDIGPRALEMFNNLGIEVFVGATGRVADAIDEWKEGALERASEKDVCEGHEH